MRNYTIAIGLFLLIAGSAPAAATDFADNGPAGHAGRDQQALFDSDPVSDATLVAVAGRAIPQHPIATLRTMADQDALSVLQEVGQSGRITMDNWWAQTGAALIVSNIIAGQAGGLIK